MKKGIVASIVGVGALVVPSISHAMCPICTIGVVAGLGIAEKYGVDNTVAGIWIGALIVSMSMWTIDWLAKKHWTFKFYEWVVYVAMYALTLVPLIPLDLLFPTRPNMIWGIDRLFLGIIVGSIVFAFGGYAYKQYKTKHGKAMFPFQKVVWPIAPVILGTIVFYFITK
jgi:hypothetical protein